MIITKNAEFRDTCWAVSDTAHRVNTDDDTCLCSSHSLMLYHMKQDTTFLLNVAQCFSLLKDLVLNNKWETDRNNKSE